MCICFESDRHNKGDRFFTYSFKKLPSFYPIKYIYSTRVIARDGVHNFKNITSGKCNPFWTVRRLARHRSTQLAIIRLWLLYSNKFQRLRRRRPDTTTKPISRHTPNQQTLHAWPLIIIPPSIFHSSSKRAAANNGSSPNVLPRLLLAFLLYFTLFVYNTPVLLPG